MTSFGQNKVFGRTFGFGQKSGFSNDVISVSVFRQRPVSVDHYSIAQLMPKTMFALLRNINTKVLPTLSKAKEDGYASAMREQQQSSASNGVKAIFSRNLDFAYVDFVNREEPSTYPTFRSYVSHKKHVFYPSLTTLSPQIGLQLELPRVHGHGDALRRDCEQAGMRFKVFSQCYRCVIQSFPQCYQFF